MLLPWPQAVGPRVKGWLPAREEGSEERLGLFIVHSPTMHQRPTVLRDSKQAKDAPFTACGTEGKMATM